MEVGRDPPRRRVRERPGGPRGASLRATGFAGSAGARKLALRAGRRGEQTERPRRQRPRRMSDQSSGSPSGMNRSATPLLQKRLPVGSGPSLNTWPW